MTLAAEFSTSFLAGEGREAYARYNGSTLRGVITPMAQVLLALRYAMDGPLTGATLTGRIFPSRCTGSGVRPHRVLSFAGHSLKGMEQCTRISYMYDATIRNIR